MHSLLKGKKQSLTWWLWLITITLRGRDIWILGAHWPSRLTYLVNFRQEKDPISMDGPEEFCPRLLSDLHICRHLCTHVHLYMQISTHKWINKQTNTSNGSHYFKVTWVSVRYSTLWLNETGLYSIHNQLKWR